MEQGTVFFRPAIWFLCGSVGFVACNDSGAMTNAYEGAQPTVAMAPGPIPAAQTSATAGQLATVGPGTGQPISSGVEQVEGLQGAGVDPAGPASGEFGGAAPEMAQEAPAYCDMLGVMRERCQLCHGEQLVGGAPMSLVTHDDLLAPAISDPSRKVYELFAERLRHERSPMPPPPTSLSEDELAAFDTWLAGDPTVGAGAMCEGLPDAPAADGGEAEFTWPEGCEGNTYEITVPSHTVAANTEEHPQFVFDAPWGNQDVQMVAYRPVTDNARVLHHWILYSGGTGFGQMLISWSPGKDEDHGIPEDVGVYFPSGPDSLRLDMHYYNLGNGNAEPDTSGLEVCVTTDFKEHTATVMSLTASASAPANQRVENTSSCTVQMNAGTDGRLISVAPHMHQLGVNGKLELTRDGKTTVLHDGPFDFDDQSIYTLDDLPLQNGDVLTTTCTYENNTSQPRNFGPDSDDEMCFNFVLYYPMDEVRCVSNGFGGFF